MSYLYYFASCIFYVLLSAAFICSLIIARFYISNGSKMLDQCCLYMGKVSHTRLKGGATHHFVYPLFFSFIDLNQIKEVGWSLWPIFKLNGGRYSFCSLDEKDHLTDWVREQEDERNKDKNDLGANNIPTSLLDLAHSFIKKRTKGTKILSAGGSIRLMAHLTYFGYCFNPISVFYCLRPENEADKSEGTAVSKITSEKTANINDATKSAGESKSSIESIIVEVSNTPWIEQHCYMLDESVPNVSVTRDVELKGEKSSFRATWLKEFHVSPFMEMDYKYNFTFSEPKESVWVQSNMTKLSTGEVWFNVNFELKRIPFTPLNLLYVLLFYPFYTRVIQVLIHYEAVKLFIKGVPTFNHPKGTPVEFGFGLTDKKLIKFVAYVNKKINVVFGKAKTANKEKNI